ncbi:hypothetical protein Tco_0615115 [Tanacetum coccineum]
MKIYGLLYDKHQALFDALLNSMSLDDAIALGQADPKKILRKRYHDDDNKDEDPFAGPNQGKKTKRSRTKESEPSKKSSTTKESSNNDIEQTFDDIVNDVDQPPHDATQAKDKAPKKDWFKHLQGLLLLIQNETQFKKSMMLKNNHDPEKMYTTSITKIKVTRYKLVVIEDMIPSLWNVTKINKFSKHDVYSTQKILSVVSVKINKLHGYGHLEESAVRRVDRQKYMFKEGDFVNLHLNDIEDMLLLVAQHKLFNLEGSDIVDLKKLNLTKPQRDFLGISAKEQKKMNLTKPGTVYEYLNKQKRLMRADELYKFSDGTLKLVRDELHHRVLNFRLGYNKEMSSRKWLATKKRRSKLMVELIDKQM